MLQLEPVIQGKGQFLNRRGSRLANMIAADANGVVQGRRLDAETNRIVNELE